MSLQSIPLPGQVLTELYRNVIVTADSGAASAITESAKPAEGYRYLGNNKQRIVLIARYASEAFMPEEHLQFLTKILGACKLNLGDIALLNGGRETIQLAALQEQLSPQKIILFGIEPGDIGLPISFPQFKQQAFDSMHFLSAPDIAELSAETDEGKQLKRKLWESLKQVFGL